MNETLRVLEERRSCRKFKPNMITKEELDSVIKAGTYAPTGMGKQSPIIIAVTNKEMRDKIVKENARIMGRKGTDLFYGAPVILLVAAHKDGLPMLDGAATIENMLLEATNQGLASCWIHRAKEELELEEGRKILSFTGLNFDDYIGIGHVIIGYPNKDYKVAPKVIKENRVFIK